MRGGPSNQVALRALALTIVLLLAPAGASAFEPFASLVPCRTTEMNAAGTVRPCITCHNNANGGQGCVATPENPHCFNPFGFEFLDNGTKWDETIADGDADEDGYTNGEELCDPGGAWSVGMSFPLNCGCATRPGFPDSFPGARDGDRDGYCCRGRDMNGNGNCTDTGEHTEDFDCDDADATAHSGIAEEVCTNLLDNDCDGLPTRLDPDCVDVLDLDGDGYCPTGHDTDDPPDGACLSPGETGAPLDCDDTNPTVHGGAFENCVDGIDNSCDGLSDTADPRCTGDEDADGDGYCPIGRDIDLDGDCLGTDEDELVSDCNDDDDTIGPGATEVCDDGLDNDCNGYADVDDAACRPFFDLDGDGYCPMGRDRTRDGDCLDTAEDSADRDCDDTNAEVFPGHAEVCTTSTDDDCDGLSGLADADCGGYIDTDGDGFCEVGFDIDNNGDCTGVGEAMGLGDCDETNAEIRPGVTEICTNEIDEDCNGLTDARDPLCVVYRDEDGDGWCPIGHDDNGDGDCGDEGEAREPNDAGHDHEPTVYPGAPENCIDRLDNDLDGDVDDRDECTGDVDTDGDGYCLLGQDLNGDGDCLDAGENVGVSDCAPDDADIHPGAEESCRENRDTDCDAAIGLTDPDCYYLLDRDRDGFCEMGVDDNADGACIDEREDRYGEDCDDNNPLVNPRAVEICDDGIDNDCNGAADGHDANCPCDNDEMCDDGDPCASATCVDRRCVYMPNGTCGDGGINPPDMHGCGCRVGAGSGRTGLAWALLALGLVFVRRRRGRASPRGGASRSGRRGRRTGATVAVVVVALLAWTPQAYAFPPFRNRVPQGMTFGDGSRGPGCLICHSSEEGGGGCIGSGGAAPCLTPFGFDFGSTTGGREYRTWDAWLRDRDSDGDGRTNGQELIYFGDVFPDGAVGPAGMATRPGDASSVHTDECMLQAGSFGAADAPDNYTNCAAGANVTCADNGAATSLPANTRYFGFTCGCGAGYAGNGRRDVPEDGVPDQGATGCSFVDPCLAGGTCSDTDECASGACGARATGCTNLLGSYVCECQPGYAMIGGTCADIDECAVDNPCAPGACMNTTGGYTCTSCPAGYEVSGGKCVDVDECLTADCSGGLCLQDIPGHYSCIRCPMGYGAPAMDGTCDDVNECEVDPPCDPHANCTNEVGSFTCECKPGFDGPGEFCSDIDECLDDPCDEIGMCMNTEGSYYCQCPDGYRRVGLACQDIDECLEGTALCRRTEVCVNQIGMTYLCDCAPGYERLTEGGRCLASCGDGVRGPGEQCDDGNDAANDGCFGCLVELGYACFETDAGVSQCAMTCGDGLIQSVAHEECDDGGDNSDTIPNACRLRCVSAFCGDGVVDDGETCDAGDDNADDLANACRTDCVPAYCGDGVVDDGEECDPGGGGPLDPARCMAPCYGDGGLEGGGVGDCTCRVGARRGTSAGALIALVLMGLLVARRRR